MGFIGYLLGCYLLGSISPSALISKLKKKDIRKHGTGNLGATNTMINFGRGWAVLVMAFDIFKAFLAVKLGHWLLASQPLAAVTGGSAAVLGHVFPFYLKFKGGKGLASYGGMILALNPLLFLILLIITLAAMFIVNYGVAMPMTAAVLFPIMYGLFMYGEHSVTIGIWAGVIAAGISAVIAAKHFSNIGKARRGEDTPVREYVKKIFSK